jgi:hypothetical protein
MASRCVPHGPVAALVAASGFVTTFRSETWEISTYDSGVKRRVWVLAIFLVVLGATACSGSDIDAVAGATQDLAAAPDSVTTPTAPPATAMPPTAMPPTAVPTASPKPTATRPTPAPPTVIEPVVFNDDFGTSIAPIFADNCASCHNAGGPGAVHWRLEQATDLVDTHEWITAAVSTGYMPPWPASDLSLIFHDNRSLRSDEIEAIQAWSGAGAPLDVADTTLISSSTGVVALDADVEIGPLEPFQGSTAVADDYRCLIYELDIDESRWLSGFEFVPDQTQIVHHAIGYLAPGSVREDAQRLSDEDDLGGWSCYGGSGLRSGDALFLGWAPGQLPTEFPDGAGMLVEPGDFIVLQIHYHFDTADAPEDRSTIKLDWADGQDLDEIVTETYLGPAEIPCTAEETGPLCDRDVALARAYERYGVQGVQADFINRVCRAKPEDFADMTEGIASSTCTIPVRNSGEIVSVFGHQHEIGKSVRMTLNAGTPRERILLDIPDWDFDWQYNYYPTESVVLRPGDTVQLDCVWDRSRRAPDLEPAYILWADGTNDEMCFATIATRRATGAQPAAPEGEGPVDAGTDVGFALPPAIEACLQDAGSSLAPPPQRDEIDATVEALFACAEPTVIGEVMTSVLANNFGGLVGADSLACLSDGLATPDAVRSMLAFTLADAAADERLPVGELVGDCVSLSDALADFGFTLPDYATDCVDEAGRLLLVQATIDGELPEQQTLFGAISPCLAGG